MKKKLKGIYAISPDIDITDAKARRRLLESTERMLEAGLAMMQFRSKFPESKQRTQLAKDCRRLCRQYHGLFIINDDVSLARLCQADGVHVGQSDMPVQELRAQLGDDAIIGVSCHGDIVLAETAVQNGADYIAFGRFFPSVSKPDAPPADIRILQQARIRFDVAIVAIGGIREENAEFVIQAGADMLALIDGLYSSKDIGATMKKLHRLFSVSRHPGQAETVPG